ncbi:MAG: glycosyltransferase family 39 protein [Bacteroidetes bacterium]|nr:glycosyltransferase family 39 protein [Bacteroidota bacterium]
MFELNRSLLNRACWIFTCAIMCLLTLPVLIKQGMFNDAVLYTSVSLNLSKGIGSFWFPYFDEWNIININSFHEQPPLAFGIQSLFFKLLGNSIYVERVYTFLCMISTAMLIHKIWNLVVKNKAEYQGMSYLAVFLWITIPVCFWSYANNMHENTMGVCTALSVFFSLYALQHSSFKILLFTLSALCIAAAFLCKGFPGLFPIGIPFLYWLCLRKMSFRECILYSLNIVCVLFVIGIFLYFYPPSNESLSIYLFKRAFQRISDSPSVDSRFFIVGRLLSELIPAIIITALIFGIAYIKRVFNKQIYVNQQALFFLCIGLSGSLPLMLTKVQNGFYFVAALPYFGIGFAFMIAPFVNHYYHRISGKSIKLFFSVSVCFLLCVLIFSFLQKGKYSRDKEMLQDLEIIAKALPAGTRLSTSPSNYEKWVLNGYMVRLHNLSMGDILLEQKERTYFIDDKSSGYKTPDYYQLMDLPLQQFKLYKKLTR